MSERPAFAHASLPKGPDECVPAHAIFSAAESTCNSLLASHDAAKDPAIAEDLLRAMLVFACSGLDAMIKQLIRDALPKVIDRNQGAEAQLRSFVETILKRNDGSSTELIVLGLTSRDPRVDTIDRLVKKLSRDSLQSKDQIFQIAAYFDIPSPAIGKPDDLRAVFAVRNAIIHELDVNPNVVSGRTTRDRKQMVGYVDTIFRVASSFLAEAGKRCAATAPQEQSEDEEGEIIA